jgi:hypothetical protein
MCCPVRNHGLNLFFPHSLQILLMPLCSGFVLSWRTRVRYFVILPVEVLSSLVRKALLCKVGDLSCSPAKITISYLNEHEGA